MKRLSLFLILLLLMVFGPAASVRGQPPDYPRQQDNPPDICQEPDNILNNCDFNQGLAGWQPFTEDGSAHFDVLQGGGECHAPLCPAGYIVVEGHFVGGILQQIPVQKGSTYYANVVWLVFDSLSNDRAVHDATGGIGRRLGIDPNGGTDPRSPDIIWGPENWRNDCKICGNQEVTATAQADMITLFLRIDDRWRLRAGEQGYPVPPSKDQFWIDDVGMKLVAEGDPAAAPEPTDPPPTETPPPPPTETPAPEPPTETPPPPVEEESAQEAAAELSAQSSAGAEIVAEEGDQPVAEAVSPVSTPADESPAPASPGETPAAGAVAVAPPPTLTPTIPPTPTDTPEPRPRVAAVQPGQPTPASDPLPLPSAGVLGVAGTTVCAGGLILVILGVMFAGLAWLYRLGWGDVEEDEWDEDEFYALDEEAEFVEVEIVE